MPQHIASISYGKDSLAMLEAIKLLGYPLDRIITADEWATANLRCVLPEAAAFQRKMDAVIQKRYGISVEHIAATRDGKILTFEDLFYGQMGKTSKRNGQIRGWPFQRGCWVNVYLKTEPIRKATSKHDVQYLGIAANEKARIERHQRRKNIALPLVDIGWTEDDCMRWCTQSRMLSPVYTSFARDGCWFCMNQSLDRLRYLRKNHPDLWILMLKWDADSPVQFKAQYSVSMIERRIQAEERGDVPMDSRFRWAQIDPPPLEKTGSRSAGRYRVGSKTF